MRVWLLFRTQCAGLLGFLAVSESLFITRSSNAPIVIQRRSLESHRDGVVHPVQRAISSPTLVATPRAADSTTTMIPTATVTQTVAATSDLQGGAYGTQTAIIAVALGATAITIAITNLLLLQLHKMSCRGPVAPIFNKAEAGLPGGTPGPPPIPWLKRFCPLFNYHLLLARMHSCQERQMEPGHGDAMPQPQASVVLPVYEAPVAATVISELPSYAQVR